MDEINYIKVHLGELYSSLERRKKVLSKFNKLSEADLERFILLRIRYKKLCKMMADNVKNPSYSATTRQTKQGLRLPEDEVKACQKFREDAHRLNYEFEQILRGRPQGWSIF